MRWPATRSRRRSRPPGTAWYRAPDTPEMTVRTSVAAGARPLHLASWLVAVLWLAGCQTLPKPIAPSAAPEQVVAGWPARRTLLQARSQFTAQGRIGVVAGTDGFNGRIRWMQDGGRSSVSLDGPLGVGGVRI